jgi:hypothetical protein
MEKDLCPCGKPHDGWPGVRGELCQMCWEAYCSDTWWEMCGLLPKEPTA